MSDTNIKTLTVTFSIVGEKISLRCSKDKVEQLKDAAEAVQHTIAKHLRDNPNMTPQVAALITAIDCQTKLLQFLGGSTTFTDKANDIVNRIENHLERVNKNG